MVLLSIGALVFLWQSPDSLPTNRPDERIADWPSPAAPTASAADPRFSAHPRLSLDAGLGTVLVNTRSHVFHYPGSRWYGATPKGKYLSERAAMAEGYHAALNERRPADFGVSAQQ